MLIEYVYVIYYISKRGSGVETFSVSSTFAGSTCLDKVYEYNIFIKLKFNITV